ncbi:MAG: hypothetical protein ACRD4E_14645 [Bryobacteraceae bacterium]
MPARLVVYSAFLAFFAAVLPWCEAIVGALVLIGLFTRMALIAGSVLMTALMFGVCLAQDWQPPASLVIAWAGTATPKKVLQ